MALTNSENKGSFEELSEGKHNAVCYRIIDIGTHMELKFGSTTEYEKKHTVIFFWETLDEKMEDGRPFAVSKTYTASLFEAATLRKDLENWRDKSFTEEELKGFDIENLIGCTAKIEVGHTEANGDFLGGNPKIVRLSSPPGGIEKIDTINDKQAFDISVFCDEWRGKQTPETKAMCDIFDSLPNWQQEDIAKSYEYQAAVESGGSQPSDSDMDDLAKLQEEQDKPANDIPF